MVTTERLWSPSSDQSNKETPSTRMASTMARTLLRSLPSEKLGTHSMTVSFIRASFPPRVADGKLYARVHAGIRISHAGVRNMNRIGGDGDRLPRLDEIMDPHPKLRGEIKNAGAEMPGHGIRTYGREFVIGPDKAARTLNPGSKSDGREPGSSAGSTGVTLTPV